MNPTAGISATEWLEANGNGTFSHKRKEAERCGVRPPPRRRSPGSCANTAMTFRMLCKKLPNFSSHPYLPGRLGSRKDSTGWN